MKTCVLLLSIAVAVGYVKGEYCPAGQTTECHLTTCSGNQWVLNCVDGVCSCTHTEGGSQACSNNGDCGHAHTCPDGQHWRCAQGTCHCARPN